MNRKLLLSIPALLLGALTVQQAQAQPHAETPIYFNAPSTTHTAVQLPPASARATAAPAETPIYFHAHAQPVETVTTATPKRTPNAQKSVESASTPIYFRNNQG